MNIPILDLKRQFNLLKGEISESVQKTLESGFYINGPEVAELEKELQTYLNVKYAITVGNGTDALVIALKACGIKQGDEVITTPFTFFASAESIALVGAVPVFVDIEKDSLNIDPNKIEEKITNKTKAILPVHIFGRCCNMDKINEIAKKYNLKVIEDSCQAIGSEYKGKKAGSLGDLSAFSFFPTKNLGCFGDGGLITTNDDNLATICRAYKEHGGGKIGAEAKSLITGNNESLELGEQISDLYNPYKYYNYLIAHNSRLDAIQAVVLRLKLKHLDKFNSQRNHHAKYYIESLTNVGDIVLPTLQNDEIHTWHQFALKTNKKDELMKFLAENGIGTGAFYPVPLHFQKAFDYLNYKEGSLPVCEEICKQTVCLPVFPELTEEELNYIVTKIKNFFN